jgi:hypothetical protein
MSTAEEGQVAVYEEVVDQRHREVDASYRPWALAFSVLLFLSLATCMVLLFVWREWTYATTSPKNREAFADALMFAFTAVPAVTLLWNVRVPGDHVPYIVGGSFAIFNTVIGGTFAAAPSWARFVDCRDNTVASPGVPNTDFCDENQWNQKIQLAIAIMWTVLVAFNLFSAIVMFAWYKARLDVGGFMRVAGKFPPPPANRGHWPRVQYAPANGYTGQSMNQRGAATAPGWR